MIKNSLLRAASALTVAALLTACGDSASSTGPTVSAAVATGTTLDVAAVSADAAKEDVEMFKVNRGAFGIAQAIDFERFERWSNCPYDATAKRFICVDRVRGPFTATRSYAYADAAGGAQSAYSESLTAAANFKWSLNGTITREKWTGSMSRDRDITLSGLLGANNTVTVNGTGTAEKMRTTFLRDTDGPNGLTRSYNMESALVIKNVVTAAVRLPDAWPTSGTITRDFKVTRTDATAGTTVTTRNSVVTFNGTQFVDLTVNGTAFTLDLGTGKVTPKVTAS